MSTETNEMDVTYAGMPTSGMDVDVSLAKADDAGGISIENPTVANNDMTPSSISVYAHSINPTSYMGDDNIASFDVIFSISITDQATGSITTHQVVKRIGVDKMKMAYNAKMTTPVSVVEAKKPAPKEESRISSDRIKALAGVKK